MNRVSPLHTSTSGLVRIELEQASNVFDTAYCNTLWFHHRALDIPNMISEYRITYAGLVKSLAPPASSTYILQHMQASYVISPQANAHGMFYILPTIVKCPR
jgi:hypothetical protein